MPKLTTNQELRAQFMETMLNRPSGAPGSTMEMMLQVDAIVTFVLTSEIVGLPSDQQEEPKALRRTGRRQGARTTH